MPRPSTVLSAPARSRPAPASANVIPIVGPRHRQLPRRRENADACVGPGSLRRKYECGFGESHFIRDPLHPPLVNSCGIEEHGQLVAREWLIRKNIEMD